MWRTSQPLHSRPQVTEVSRADPLSIRLPPEACPNSCVNLQDWTHSMPGLIWATAGKADIIQMAVTGVKQDS